MVNAELVRAYALSGRQAESRESLAELLSRSKHRDVSGYVLATVHAALDEKAQAFAHLQHAAEQLGKLIRFRFMEEALDKD